MNKLKIPYPEAEYFLDEDNKVLWLRGSLARAWAKKELSAQYGYEIKLATQAHIDDLKGE